MRTWMMHMTCKIQIQETGATRKWIILLPAIGITGMNRAISTNKPKIIATPEEANNKIALIMNLKAGQAIAHRGKIAMMIMVTGNPNKEITMTATNKTGEINPVARAINGPVMHIMKPVTGMIAMTGIGVAKAIQALVAGTKMIVTGMT